MSKGNFFNQLQNHFEMECCELLWAQLEKSEKGIKTTSKHYPSRACDRNELGDDKFKQGHIFLCSLINGI
jgi:hypothetical protein